MPFKRFKCIASKNKEPPQERRNQQPEGKRELSASELSQLSNRFSMDEIYWFMHNNDTKVGEFVNKILVSEEARILAPKKDLLDNYLDDLLHDYYQPDEDDNLEEETVAIRYCTICETYGANEEMAKYCKCGYWNHTFCANEPDQEGKDDPNFSFWLCPKCKPDPKLILGYEFTYQSKIDIEVDKHYEDSDPDSGEDFRVKP